MAKTKAIAALKHIDLFNAEKAQAIRDLGQKHGDELRALHEAQAAEYEATMGGIDRQRKLDVVEAVGRYVAAGLPVPHEVYNELGQQRAVPYAETAYPSTISSNIGFATTPVAVKSSRGY